MTWVVPINIASVAYHEVCASSFVASGH
jgi:hypothetical protein